MTTTHPSNPSELQLYRVLLQANLLHYYETFIAQGGDDVQQLCEAGEEEFLEIMALVGMASKPLHVRRLQKALQEWVVNPGSFQGTSVRKPPTHVYSLPTLSTADSSTSSPWCALTTPQKCSSPVHMVTPRLGDVHSNASYSTVNKKQVISPGQTPILLEEQIKDLASCAAKLTKGLPLFEAKPLNLKKEINKQIIEIIATPNDLLKDRLELMRRYGSIYRRFDSDRTYQKPMSMHEVCVNEAAAQLCFHMPNLLTRREDLFPLARQVVKDSGYQYSKGHSRALEVNPENPSKRQKIALMSDYKGNSLSGKCAGDKHTREERLKQISRELASMSEKQETIVNNLEAAKEAVEGDKLDLLQSHLEQITNQHLQLLTEQSDLLRKQSSDVYTDAGDTGSDREDSSLGPCGSSSPSQNDKLELEQQHTALKAMLTTGQIPKSSLASLCTNYRRSNNTLFDEGLRIAQQYGLGDFAQKLKCLQDDGTDEDETDQMQLSRVQNLFSSVPNDVMLNCKASINRDGSDNELNSKRTDGIKCIPIDSKK